MNPLPANRRFYLLNRHGFTLLEVLVALAVLGIVLVSALHWTSWALANGQHNSRQMAAIQAIEEALASVTQERHNETRTNVGKDTGTGEHFQIEAAASRLSSEATSSGLTALQRIEVMVRGPDGEVLHRLITYRHDAGDGT